MCVSYFIILFCTLLLSFSWESDSVSISTHCGSCLAPIKLLFTCRETRYHNAIIMPLCERVMARTCSITHCRCFPLELQPLSRPPGSEGDILHSYSTAARASYSRAGWISQQYRPRSCLLFNDLFWARPCLKTENDRDSNLASCLLAAFQGQLDRNVHTMVENAV